MDFEKRWQGHDEGTCLGNDEANIADADQSVHRKLHLPSGPPLSSGLVRCLN